MTNTTTQVGPTYVISEQLEELMQSMTSALVAVEWVRARLEERADHELERHALFAVRCLRELVSEAQQVDCAAVYAAGSLEMDETIPAGYSVTLQMLKESYPHWFDAKGVLKGNWYHNSKEEPYAKA